MKKGNMSLPKIALYKANPKTLTNPILPVSVQSRRRNGFVDKSTALFAILLSVQFPQIIMDLSFLLALREPLNSTTTLTH